MVVYKPHVHYQKESNGNWKVTVLVYVPANKTLIKGPDSGTVVDSAREFDLTIAEGSNPDPQQLEYVFNVTGPVLENEAWVIVKDSGNKKKGKSHCLEPNFDTI